MADQIQAKTDEYKLKNQQTSQASEVLKEAMPHSLKWYMVLAQEKGASSWHTSLPIEEFGYAIHMQVCIS